MYDYEEAYALPWTTEKCVCADIAASIARRTLYFFSVYTTGGHGGSHDGGGLPTRRRSEAPCRGRAQVVEECGPTVRVCVLCDGVVSINGYGGHSGVGVVLIFVCSHFFFVFLRLSHVLSLPLLSLIHSLLLHPSHALTPAPTLTLTLHIRAGSSPLCSADLRAVPPRQVSSEGVNVGE